MLAPRRRTAAGGVDTSAVGTRGGMATASTGRTGGQRVVDALISAGVRHVFGIPGTFNVVQHAAVANPHHHLGATCDHPTTTPLLHHRPPPHHTPSSGTHTVPIYKELEARRGSIHHITTRHESGAGYAADGYARATGDMAAVCVITGVGLTNTITPMAVALADSVPMLVISSEVPQYWQGKPSRQYSHFVPNCGGLAASVCKPGGSFSVKSADDIADTVLEACTLARSGRPGPVHVSIGIEMLTSPAASFGSEVAAGIEPSALPAVQKELEAVAQVLTASQRPVIIAGGGTVGASALLTTLAEALDAPVLSTVAGK